MSMINHLRTLLPALYTGPAVIRYSVKAALTAEARRWRGARKGDTTCAPLMTQLLTKIKAVSRYGGGRKYYKTSRQ